jgi:CDP-glucose 4,6-dehydratase
MGKSNGTLETMGVMSDAMARLPNADFWRGKRVLLTGHTGFKGAWAALWLAKLGAIVTGFALPPDTKPALFEQAEVDQDLTSILGDLRDWAAVEAAVQRADPEIALLMAAQPIVRRAIADPIETIAINVLGAAQVLWALRQSTKLSTIVMVTSDKVYNNDELGRPFVETDPLGGKDPYSASKAAAELVTQAFAQSYFSGTGHYVVTARAGNVIGGGDYGEDRLIPDIVRAALAKKRPILRLPQATRPWQHVLDSLAGYLLFAETLSHGRPMPHALNFGPEAGPSITVAALAQSLLAALGNDPEFEHRAAVGSLEIHRLAVDSRRAHQCLGWRPRLRDALMVDWTAAWYRAVHAGQNARAVTLAQIDAYAALA